jgi:predicted nucleotidyltransferase
VPLVPTSGARFAPLGAVKIPGTGDHGAHETDPLVIDAVLADVVRILDAARLPYVTIGGTASWVHGRPRSSGDIDLLVRPSDAPRALETLAEHGFDTERTDEHWLYKAFRDNVLVDVLFRSSGDIFLDDTMLERSRLAEFRGTALRLIAPEDLLVIKALAHREETPRHWYDALAVIARSELDWDYVVERARKGPRRVLSLLVYATSVDLLVPAEPIRQLYESVYGGGDSGA